MAIKSDPSARVSFTYSGNQLSSFALGFASYAASEASLAPAPRIGSGDGITYTYDLAGNLVSDPLRGLSAIVYNEINRPAGIRGRYRSDMIQRTYSADGRKLAERITSSDGLSDVRRRWIGPFEMTDGTLTRIHIPRGFLDPARDGASTTDRLHLYIPDHQGNIAGVVRASTRQLEQFTDYYPYGQPHPDCVNPQLNRRLFSGKELTTAMSLNEYDFHARSLTLFGSFTAPDPLATKYPWLSPYAYCASDPINFIDPTGLGWVYGETEEGLAWTWNPNINSNEEAVAAGFTDYRNPGSQLYGTIRGTGRHGLVELEDDGKAHYVEQPSPEAPESPQNDADNTQTTPTSDEEAISEYDKSDSILESTHKKVSATDFGASLLEQIAEGEAASGVRGAKNVAKGLKCVTSTTPYIDIALTSYEMASYIAKGGRNPYVYLKYATDLSLTIAPLLLPGLGFGYVGAMVLYYYVDIYTNGFGIDYSTPN